MHQYICLVCGRHSYSATDPAHALSDKCPYEGCEGHVKLAEPKRATVMANIIKMVRKENNRG